MVESETWKKNLAGTSNFGGRLVPQLLFCDRIEKEPRVKCTEKQGEVTIIIRIILELWDSLSPKLQRGTSKRGKNTSIVPLFRDVCFERVHRGARSLPWQERFWSRPDAFAVASQIDHAEPTTHQPNGGLHRQLQTHLQLKVAAAV
jgi:hypothetical protein